MCILEFRALRARLILSEPPVCGPSFPTLSGRPTLSNAECPFLRVGRNDRLELMQDSVSKPHELGPDALPWRSLSSKAKDLNLGRSWHYMEPKIDLKGAVDCLKSILGANCVRNSSLYLTHPHGTTKLNPILAPK